MKKTITFISQLADAQPSQIKNEYGEIISLETEKRFGVRVSEELTFWAWRACGIANVAMVLASENKLDKSLYDLVSEGQLLNGYAFRNRHGKTDVGWKHKVLVKLLKNRGFKAKTAKMNLEKIKKVLSKGHYVIASVVSQTGGHMVLVKEIQNNTVVFNDPYTFGNGGGENKKLSIKDFSNIYKGRSIETWLS